MVTSAFAFGLVLMTLQAVCTAAASMQLMQVSG